MSTTSLPRAKEVTNAARDALAAFNMTRSASAAERGVWLEATASALEDSRDELVAIAAEETHLTVARLEGEVARTATQLRLFAATLADGGYVEAIIDHARPEATPPTPDLRRMLQPLGPVAVFSASNFPFAFSVLGGDTASAIAAGCPVIVKAHSGHPSLSARTAEVALAALQGAGAPAGILGLVRGRAAGTALVTAPEVAAVGFTGSVQGGRALFDLASARPDPIPFYGELGSVNPVFVTAKADAARSVELAAGLVTSFQLGHGQFCTKPGLVFIPEGGRFEGEVAALLGESGSARLLTASIEASYRERVAKLSVAPGVRRVGGAPRQPDHAGASSVVFATDIATASANPELLEETFGPTTLLVSYTSLDDALHLAARLGGSLTATLHAEPGEPVADLARHLTAITGRVLFAGWPTGVAVTWAQHHGGPWPATTSPHTSVGPTAIRRFLRPVAYQSAPTAALPPELRDGNPLGIPRRVDGAVGLR
ncbi:aldehyde dehydrogenase (NADP(+)) [Microbacterium sp. NPDC019599]|uniref:aldehyde dehydrogenase (NADP(+)) n=1 Tax=Microbacterium sp. NPDC019599 TaxID=3154690 RepID=UPI0034006E36